MNIRESLKALLDGKTLYRPGADIEVRLADDGMVEYRDLRESGTWQRGDILHIDCRMKIAEARE